jgi:glucokinase
MQPVAIGIDLGATNIKGVLIDKMGTLVNEAKRETNEQDAKHWKQAVVDMIGDFTQKAGRKVDAIGLSAPGLANADNQCIAIMPGRLEGLEHFIWSEWVGQKVWVLNDGHAAMMAEAAFGAARGMQHAVLLTLGTGVGGGLLIHGQLYQGVGQRAGHFGHTSVDADSAMADVTNMPGSIEVAMGNVTLPERSQGKYHSTEALVADYLKGDPFATEVWITSVRKLAVSIASAINVISPEVVVISGGITKAKDALMKPLQDFLQRYEWQPGGTPTMIRFAHFSDKAGAIGAASFAFSKLK